jgi:hypothetical protein
LDSLKGKNVLKLKCLFPRFGITLGFISLKEISAGEELLQNYDYKFEIAPTWFKDLFLKFMEEHPEEEKIIRYFSKGKTREELLKDYQNFYKLGPPNDDESATIEE